MTVNDACREKDHSVNYYKSARVRHTFVFDHPSLNAISFANSSPNPNINPFMNGNNKLIAAPRNSPQMVGGEYNISGELDDDGGDEEDNSLFAS